MVFDMVMVSFFIQTAQNMKDCGIRITSMDLEFSLFTMAHNT